VGDEKMGLKNKALVPVFLLIGVLSLFFCRRDPTAPAPPDEAPDSGKDLLFINTSIFSSTGIGGEVMVNGVKKPSGSLFTFEPGEFIETLSAEAAGFRSDYIVGTDGFKRTVYLTKDAGGLHVDTITRNTTIYLFLIPSEFDIGMLARSVGEVAGTVANYDRQDIRMGIMKGDSGGLEPTAQAIENLSQAENILRYKIDGMYGIHYIGVVDQELSNGVTFKVCDCDLEVDVQVERDFSFYERHVIQRSSFRARPDADLKTVLTGLTKAATGLMRNGCGGSFCYLDENPHFLKFKNNGEWSVKMASKLPPGFKLRLDD
jgi:hypothetical protein